jgi:hypothetical protein
MTKLLILLTLWTVVECTVGCQNAIPTVTKLESAPKGVQLSPKDAKNFAQINSGSARRTLGDGYGAVVRVSQPLANLKAQSAGGYSLTGTVTLAR